MTELDEVFSLWEQFSNNEVSLDHVTCLIYNLNISEQNEAWLQKTSTILHSTEYINLT